MSEFIFTGWVKVPVKFKIEEDSRDEAIRRAQLGNYDSYTPKDGEPPIDYLINPISGEE